MIQYDMEAITEGTQDIILSHEEKTILLTMKEEAEDSILEGTIDSTSTVDEHFRYLGI